MCHWAEDYSWTTCHHHWGHQPDTSFTPRCLQISNIFGETSTHVPERLHGWILTLCLCSWGLQVLCEAPKTFDTDHILGDAAPIIWSRIVMQFSTWALESVPGLKSYLCHSKYIQFTLFEPHFCHLVNGALLEITLKRMFWRLSNTNICKVLRTVSGAWYTCNTY